MTDTVAEALARPFPWPRPFDPPEAYAWLRQERPVTRVVTATGQPVWLVTRYDDVRAVLADPRVSADVRRPGFPLIGARPQSPGDRPFLRMDPPEHTVFRRLLAPSFTGRHAEELRPALQALVDEVVDGMLGSNARPVDLVRTLALPVPSTVLSWILGVRAEDRELFNTAAGHLLNIQDVTDPEAFPRALKAGAQLRAYLGELADERTARNHPGEDVMGRLVAAMREGTITRQDLVNTALVLVVAGHDTTASMVATGMLTLLAHPDQLAELHADPTLVPNAVEELLRFLTVVHLVILRVAAEDIEVNGQVIPAGEGIVPLNLSANRDGERYVDADRLDIHRLPTNHLAFGYGVHRCLGQPLARVELQTIFATLLRRIPTLRLAIPPEEVRFRPFSQIAGVAELPVTWSE